MLNFFHIIQNILFSKKFYLKYHSLNLHPKIISALINLNLNLISPYLTSNPINYSTPTSSFPPINSIPNNHTKPLFLFLHLFSQLQNNRLPIFPFSSLLTLLDPNGNPYWNGWKTVVLIGRSLVREIWNRWEQVL